MRSYIRCMICGKDMYSVDDIKYGIHYSVCLVCKIKKLFGWSKK